MNSKYILIAFSFLFTSTLTFLPLRCIGDDSPISPPPPKWSYSGDTGPKHWGNLAPASTPWYYWLASNGENQSPVDIVPSSILRVTNPPTVEYSYDEHSTFDIINNGHTIEVVDPPPYTNWITIDNTQYYLMQFHFHSLSEHTVKGTHYPNVKKGHYPMEVHFVHNDNPTGPDGKLAVIALFIKQGTDENLSFKPIWNMISKAGSSPQILPGFNNINPLLPSNDQRQNYQYNGSLTTPPCSEGVRWFVLKKPVEMSKTQINLFQKHAYNNNYRPTQPLNARHILSTN
jgi:carbonic anhydrase